MMKKTLLAIIAVFFAWSILEFFIHGLLLQSTYEATAHLWRPMEDMNMGLMYLVTLGYTTCFVLIYVLFVGDKSLTTGIKFGGLFGLGAGISMGFGSYNFMPIPMSLAITWFAGVLIQSLVSGALAGAIIKPSES